LRLGLEEKHEAPRARGARGSSCVCFGDHLSSDLLAPVLWPLSRVTPCAGGSAGERSHFPGSIRGGLVEICAPALHFFFYCNCATGTDVSAEGGLSDACMAGYNALTHSVGASKLLQKFEGVLWLWGWAVNSTTYVRVRSSHVMLLLGRLDQDAGVVGSFGCGRRRIVTRAVTSVFTTAS
jgi:hypothetical protein